MKTMHPSKRSLAVSLVLGLTSTIASSVSAAPVGPGDWSKVRLYGHAFENADYTADQYGFIKTNYYIFTIEKRHAQNVYGPCSTEVAAGLTANKIVAANPNCRVLYYWNSDVVYDAHYSTIANIIKTYPTWYFADPTSPSGKTWNFPTSASRNWWANAANTELATYSSLRGVFVDAIPGAVVNGHLSIIEAQMDRLDGLVIYNGYRVANNTVYGGSNTLAHADGVFIEAFFTTPVDTTAEAVKLMDLLLAIPGDKYIICRGCSGPFGTTHNFTLAAYLIVANNRSFYAWMNSYEADTSMYWHADFGRRLGAPKAKAVKNGYVYTRSFEYADVTVNVSTKTSSIVWK
jgi:Hypothetical glycosyl hydrolase family 15